MHTHIYDRERQPMNSTLKKHIATHAHTHIDSERQPMNSTLEKSIATHAHTHIDREHQARRGSVPGGR